MKKTSKAVKKSRDAAGIKSTSFALSEAERAEIKALAVEMGASQKEAIMAAVRRYRTQGAMTNELLLEEIRKRFK